MSDSPWPLSREGTISTWSGSDVGEVFLHPGGFYFGGGRVRVRTVLGSCVAIALWHKATRVGGMCHFLLPRGDRDAGTLNGLYAEEAIELFLREVRQRGTSPREYETVLVGGGRMFAALPFNVAGLNVEAGRALLQANGFRPPVEHAGGMGHRQVGMELWSGRVQVSHVARATGGG